MDRTDPVAQVLRSKGSDVHAVSPQTCVFDALALMAEKQIGALLVMENGLLAGVISERDYARKVILQGRSSKETRVDEIMTEDLVTVSPSDTIDDCMKLMTEYRVRHLPVLSGDAVVGVVSMGDLVRYVITAQREEIQHLHAYISGSYAV